MAALRIREPGVVANPHELELAAQTQLDAEDWEHSIVVFCPMRHVGSKNASEVFCTPTREQYLGAGS
jgi:hypothetical protein